MQRISGCRAGAVSISAMILIFSPAAGAGDVAAGEQRFLTGVRQITFDGRRAGEGYFSRDGRELVFQSEREPGNPFYQIYLMDLETGDTERISPGIGKTTCAWIHPDGKRVLFASTHSDPLSKMHQEAEIKERESGRERRYAWDYDEHFDLYEFDRSTKQFRNLSNTRGYDAEGSYSPDGSLIAFASNRHAFTDALSEADQQRFEIDPAFLCDIYIMNADGTDVRRLTDVKGYDGGPFFSADGERICWRRFSEGGETAEIFTMNLDGSNQRQLTRLGAMSWAPFYHPSGEYLIFTTNRHGFANFELYLVSADGAETIRVTWTDGFDGLPAFSPDGKRLAWTSTRGGVRHGQLFIGDWNHEEARTALRDAARARTARAAPDQDTLPPELAALPDTTAAIEAADIHAHVERLAGDAMEGRLTGTTGERLATAYVARAFSELGLQPAGDDGQFFQEFEFTSGVSLGAKNRLSLLTNGANPGDPQPVCDRDWRPLAFSATGEFAAAGIVFAGYGIVAPRSGDAEAYDAYGELDVTGKWVLIFRFMPEAISPERRQQLNRYASLRHKAMIARDRGARGVIVVSGPNATVKEELVPLAFDASLASMSLPVISITNAVADSLVSHADETKKGGRGRTLRELQDALDGGGAAPGFPLGGARIEAAIDLEKEKRTGRNVLARLMRDGVHDRAPALILGAHVDHLGRGDGAGSLARDDEKGQIHFGADDNASGVAALIEIAEHLVDAKKSGRLDLKRDVIFAAWSGEELGLIGSNHFVAGLGSAIGDPANLRAAVAAYLNMDMVGRLDKSLILAGVGSSSVWKGEIERRNAPIGLNIALQDDAYLPTDATAFYLKGVPVLSAFTGAHAEYHTPRDRPELLNYEGAAKIARLMALIARSLATSDDLPDYIQTAKPAGSGERAGLRAYLGTIPDYAPSEEPGVLLSGVATAGPAHAAGVRGGDRIVELAGKKIENIYDYTYALDALKVGEPATIVVTRSGQRLTFRVTAGSRE